MSGTVDDILKNVELIDDVNFWTVERLENLQIIGVASERWQEVSTSLDSLPVTIRILYNDTDDGFFCDIVSSDGTLDVKGLRANTNTDMLDGLALPFLGKLYIVDLEKIQIDPTFESFGTRFLLAYLPSEFAR